MFSATQVEAKSWGCRNGVMYVLWSLWPDHNYGGLDTFKNSFENIGETRPRNAQDLRTDDFYPFSGAPMSSAGPMSTGPPAQSYGNQPMATNQQQPMGGQAGYSRPMGQQNMMQQGNSEARGHCCTCSRNQHQPAVHT